MKTRILLATIATTTMLSLPVLAQTVPVTTPVAPVVNPGGPMQPGVPNPTPNIDPGHPRVSQVQGWVNQQETNTENAEAAGKITSTQEQRDLSHDQNIQNSLDKDMSQDGGHITGAEQHNLDSRLNTNYDRRADQSARDSGQPVPYPGAGRPNPTPNIDPGHPRVSQVQGWVNQQESNTVKAEEAGKITGAQEQRDLSHDQHIQNRLDRDMSHDGGHITRGEQGRLDHSLGKNYNRRTYQEKRDAK